MRTACLLTLTLFAPVAFAGDHPGDPDNDGCDNDTPALDTQADADATQRLSSDQLFTLLKLREERRGEVSRSGFREDFIIPVVSIMAVLFAVGLALTMSYRKELARQETVRAIIAKGEPVDATLLLGVPRHRDLRRGVVLVALGAAAIPFLAFGPWAGGGLWTAGLVPLAVGAGLLGVWWVQRFEAS